MQTQETLAQEMLAELKRLVDLANANAGQLMWEDVEITKALIKKAEAA
jgi:hypothetical protein